MHCPPRFMHTSRQATCPFTYLQRLKALLLAQGRTCRLLRLGQRRLQLLLLGLQRLVLLQQANAGGDTNSESSVL